MDQDQQLNEDEGLGRFACQVIQNERWITIGRLIAGICHDITNRMQAIQGSLALAVEEQALSDDMKAYLSICQQESQRVNLLIERLRYIYHPESDRPATVDLISLLKEIGSMASDAMTSRGVTIEMDLPASLPLTKCKLGQLQFVLLGSLLNLTELIGVENGGCIRVRAIMVGPIAQIELSTDTPLLLSPNRNGMEKSEAPTSLIEHALGIPALRQAILSQNGDISFLLTDSGLSIWIGIPVA